MKLKSNEYQIECTPDGNITPFNRLPTNAATYGETAEEALETLSDIADEFFSRSKRSLSGRRTRIKVTQPIIIEFSYRNHTCAIQIWFHFYPKHAPYGIDCIPDKPNTNKRPVSLKHKPHILYVSHSSIPFSF